MKKLLLKQRGDRPHWVGDGFPVRTIFSYQQNAALLSPFLLMDHAGPTEFSPTEKIRGVGEHPHRGFETVTIVYDGEVEHRDSTGGGGLIRAGDVQWMTAASGLVHEEMHGRDYSRRGGPFEMIQLWVNLPAKDKMSKPGYQGIQDAQIPRVQLPNDGGFVRVIAGEYAARKGPAKTFTPINLWDVRLAAGQGFHVEVPRDHTLNVFVLSGEVRLGDGKTVEASELAVFAKDDQPLPLVATSATKLLVLSGKPIDEPIAGYGPFVMNTPQQIHEAMADFNAGRMGRLAKKD